MMLEHNRVMKEWLKENGIDAMPKWIDNGSLKWSWRLYNHRVKWTMELVAQLTSLGFRGMHGELTQYDGNGGIFSVFVRGNNPIILKRES